MAYLQNFVDNKSSLPVGILQNNTSETKINQGLNPPQNRRFFRGGWWLCGWPPVAGWLIGFCRFMVASHHSPVTSHQGFSHQVASHQKGWWLWLVAGGWWLVAGGWWLVAGGWWLVAGCWWLVASLL